MKLLNTLVLSMVMVITTNTHAQQAVGTAIPAHVTFVRWIDCDGSLNIDREHAGKIGEKTSGTYSCEVHTMKGQMPGNFQVRIQNGKYFLYEEQRDGSYSMIIDPKLQDLLIGPRATIGPFSSSL